MRKVVLSLALVLTGVVAADAVAQQRKKTEKQDEQSAPTSGYQRCEGSLFLIPDGGTGPRCQLRDGRVCQVRGGTSGQAVLTDCK